MKKGQICEGVVERYAFPNKGYVRVQDEKQSCQQNTAESGEAFGCGDRSEGSGQTGGTVREICIKGALKGQKVRFSVKKLRKGGGEGKLLQVLEKSPMEDVTPACPHFGQCGGCAYQTMSYKNQLALKEEQVKALLDSVLDTSAYLWEGIKGSPVQEAYRNKMEFSFGDEFKDGPLALGMHKKGSFHDIITVDSCRLVDEDYNRILRTVLDFYTEKRIPFYKKMKHTGVLRHLVLRQAACSGDILVNLVTTTQDKDTGEHLSDGELAKTIYLEELRDKLLALKLNGTIAGILHTHNDSLSDAVIPEKIVTIYGKDYIYEKILGLTFRISPFSFFQTNSRGAEVLYEAARSYVGETKDKVIFDLYSGTGTIAQMLAPVAKKVIGVEIVGEAVEAAKENAALNGLANCEFIAGDVLKVVDEIEEKPDIIILDPPRDGIHPKALEKIIAFGVEEMVYISCKPTSLIRDLEILKARGYDVVKACAIDQFVGTLHVETVVKLSLKKDVPKIEVTMEPDEESNYTLEEKATYQKIKDYVKDKYGVNVHTSYIAQVKRMCGIEMCENYNKSKKENPEVKRCPKEKEEYIKDALRYYKII